MLLACHLLRDIDDDICVTLIQKSGRTVGRGMAYSTAQPGHLLNVRATNMSAFADDPLHFCRWLVEHDDEFEGERNWVPSPSAQRRVYGRYISELIMPQLPPNAGRARPPSASLWGGPQLGYVTPLGVRTRHR